MNLVGYKVELKTKADEVHVGVVWAHDKKSGLVTLQCPSTSGTPEVSNIVMIKSSHIAEVVSAEAPEEAPVVELKKLDVSKLMQRERRAIELMEKTIRSLGKGVTPQAQDIFDALEKTMPCEWKDTNIEVFGEVMIDSPYSLEHCHFKEGSSRNAMMMDRVQTVLSEELKRQSASGAEATAARA